MRTTLSTLIALSGFALAGFAHAGPFAPAAGSAGSTAIHKDSAAFVQWATGYSDYQPGSNVDAAWKNPAEGLGKAEGT